MKACTKCGTVKPLGDFYSDKRSSDGRVSWCKKCSNHQRKKFDHNRIVRNRAHHRAAAELKRRHSDEYEALFTAYREEAEAEARLLAASERAAAHYGTEPPRLRTGRRNASESLEDRIDVARCPDCIRHHDAGHVCANCGAVPHTTVAVPDDGEIDEVAVERAVRGEPVALTPSEQREAFRVLASRGASDAAIAERLHISNRTVMRWRQSEGIESRWTA